ncbi:hypothetical protein [Streptomyces lushanensis]|uniref:hypothetical protein n=1 Tax=Streptomyces lushanensis TaxID=1434255 RepID=UPI00114C9A83|nr:hypothetical protein [Streptomyces lushanensis]
MPEPRDFTMSRLQFHTYKVGRSLLDRLFAVASEGVNPEQLEFSTTRSGTTFTRKSLEELVSAVAASPTPGDPEIWSELDFSYYEIERSVRIDFSTLGVRVSIRSGDATWVHGQAARIRALLEPVAGEERPWVKQSRTARRIGLVAGGLAWVAAFFALRENVERIDGWLAASASILIASVVFAVINLLGVSGKVKSKAQLNVVGEIADGGWWKNLDTMERVAFGALLVTAVAAVGTLGSAYSDLWGGR